MAERTRTSTKPLISWKGSGFTDCRYWTNRCIWWAWFPCPTCRRISPPLAPRREATEFTTEGECRAGGDQADNALTKGDQHVVLGSHILHHRSRCRGTGLRW